jgi:serine phosphatase RsbU (regulator of sigma subunit)
MKVVMESQISSRQQVSSTQKMGVFARKLEFGKWIMYVVFGIALLVFLDAPVLAIAWGERPFAGFLVEQTLVVTDTNGIGWSGREEGIGHPQRLTHIAGREVHTSEEVLEITSNLSLGERIEIRTRFPDGSARTYPFVEVQPFPQDDMARLFWLPYGVGLAYLAIGFWLFRLRGHTAPGRAFAFFCANAAITNALLFDLITTHAGSAIWTMAISQLGGALFSLAMVFPQEWHPVRRFAQLRYFPYLISIGLMFWGLYMLNSALDPWAYIQAWRLSYFYTAFGILVFFAILLFQQWTNPSAVARQQARLILWGSVIAFAPVGVWLSAPLFGVSIPWNPVVFVSLLVFFPISVSLAILRYRMWDVDVIINRTLVYGGLSLLLGLIYFGSVMVLSEILRNFTHQTSEIAAVVSTLAIVALFNPLRANLQNFIDRRFYHHKYDVAKTLVSLGASLREEVDLTSLLERLEAVIWEAIMPAHVLVWLRTAAGYSIQRAERTAFVEEPGLVHGSMTVTQPDPILGHFNRIAAAVDIDSLEMESPGLEWLKTSNAKVAVPLISQGELVGWISLGPRLSEQDYSADDRSLLTNLAAHAAPALRVAQLVAQQQAETLRRERLDNEMRVARMIQNALLPKELPNLVNWEVGAYYQPAREVGGDFYDFFYFGDGRLGLFIGDVTDKGVPAAMVMTTTISLLRAVARQVSSPGEILRRVNDLLEPDIPDRMFVTCLCAILDPATGTLMFANAGHSLPVKRTDHGVVELRATGIPLGLMPDMEYEELEADIAPGECLIFYSDGLIEAHNPDREMFGSERLFTMLDGDVKDSQSLINCLLSELKAFTGVDWEQEDDVTLVGLRRLIADRS